MLSKINIKNKKAGYQYELLDRYTAGIQLTGTEIKSIRAGNVSFVDAFCVFKDSGLWAKGIHIAEYSFGSFYNHDPKRDRKLLLKKRELNKIKRKITEKGYTLIPIRLFINEKGLAKLEIAVAKGKRSFDKREAIKRKDAKRDIDRLSRNDRY